jgi:hypothetical protein
MAAARFLKQSVGPDEAVIVDSLPQYLDINVAFYTGLPDERLVRRRWENFEKHLAQTPAAPWLLLGKGGELAEKEVSPPGGATVSFRGRTFDRVDQPSEFLAIYRQR